jgi:hypothetical protein
MAGRAGAAGIAAASVAKYGVTIVHGRAKALGRAVAISHLGPVAARVASLAARAAVRVADKVASSEAARAAVRVADKVASSEAARVGAKVAAKVVAKVVAKVAAKVVAKVVDKAADKVVDKVAVGVADPGIAKRRKDQLKPGLSAGLFFSRSISPLDR